MQWRGCGSEAYLSGSTSVMARAASREEKE